MGYTISNWLRRLSTGPVTLIALVVFVLFTALVLPGQSAPAEQRGAGSPDTGGLYTPADLYRMAEAYGEEGRAAYIRARFSFDLVWPLVYLAFLTTSVSWLNRRAFAPASRWQRTNLLPVVGCVFDYLENIAAALVMARFPARSPVIDVLTPIFSALKWGFIGAGFVALVAGVVLALWQWRKRRRAHLN